MLPPQSGELMALLEFLSGGAGLWGCFYGLLYIRDIVGGFKMGGGTGTTDTTEN